MAAFLALLCAGLGGVAAEGFAAEKKAKAAAVELADSPAAAVRQFLDGWQDPQVRGLIDSLGEQIAVQREQAAAVLDLLEQDASIEAATLRADLLVWIARGDETPQWKRKGRMFKPDTTATDELGRRAAGLLAHPDPFVRGLAEWALAIRLTSEYECAEERVNGRRVAKQWPGADAPDWYQTWAAIGADERLDLDYVRQAAALGLHRTTADLVADAAAWCNRSEELLDYVRQVGTPAQAAVADEHHARLASVLDELKQAAGGGHYMFPYPLSDKSFLVSYSYKRPEENAGQNFSLYYIDVWGNKELIHRDRQMSVAFLSPVQPTPRPPVIEEPAPAPADGPRYAVASVVDVHAGWTDAEPRIKYLRICQKVPWPCVRDESKSCGFNDLHWMPAAWEPVLGMWDWGHARVIGIVPVEPDGSAHFKVPADQTIYFQALDENYLELRRMRSNVTFRAGESRGCIGCHESQAIAPPYARSAGRLAMRRPPSTPEPPPWGDRVVPDYEQHIQPIFERHCVRCHGEQNPDGDIELTARRIDGYLQSYRALFGLRPADATPFARGYWSIWRPNEPPLSDEAANAAKTFLRNVLRDPPDSQLVSLADYTGGAEVTQPRQFGSGKSKLTRTLIDDAKHREECRLTPDEWLTLVTWLDLNVQYWGTFVEKDGHFASRRSAAKGGSVLPPRRVRVLFPDPWTRPPAGEWMWRDEQTVVLKD